MKRYLKTGTGPSQRISIGNESGFGTKDLTAHDADGHGYDEPNKTNETKAVR